VETESEVPEEFARVVVRGAGIASAIQLTSQAIALVFYMAIARLTTPAVFGAFAAASIIVSATGLFVESGMQAAIIQRRERVEEAAATAVLATLGAGAGFSLVALAAWPVIGLYFHSREVGVVAASLSALPFLNVVPLIPGAMMTRRFLLLRRVILEPVAVCTYGLATTAALSAGMGIWGFVVGSYVSAFFRAVAAWVLARWRPDFRRASFAIWRELARFGRHVVASELLTQSAGIGTTALVGRFLGAVSLGYYRAASRMAAQATIPIVSAGAAMLLPAFARIADDEVRLRRGAMRALRLQCVVVFPLALAFIPLGEQVMILLLGEPWAPAGPVLAALSGQMALLPLGLIASEVFKGAGRPWLVTRLSALSTVATLAAVAAFLPLGAVGAALGVSLAALVVGLYSVWSLSRVLGVGPSRILVELAPPAVAAAVMAGMLGVLDRVVQPGGGTLARIVFLALEGLVGLAVYSAALAVIKPTLFRELIDLRRLRHRVPLDA
jgi:PST family polysaccharide transporter